MCINTMDFKHSINKRYHFQINLLLKTNHLTTQRSIATTHSFNASSDLPIPTQVIYCFCQNSPLLALDLTVGKLSKLQWLAQCSRLVRKRDHQSSTLLTSQNSPTLTTISTQTHNHKLHKRMLHINKEIETFIEKTSYFH